MYFCRLVCKLYLLRGSLTQFHSVLDYGLNLHWNIPLRIGHRNLNNTLNNIGMHPTGFGDYCLLPETAQCVHVNNRKCSRE